MIDSHCHLDPQVWEDVDAVVARARVAGLTGMVAVGAGYGLPSARAAVDVARRHPDVRATVGIHPHDAKDAAGLPELWDLARADEVVAVGEIGLDFHYDLSPRDQQRQALRDQLAFARELGKPVVIHDRDSGGEILTHLDDARAWDGGVLFHCYSGDVDTMVEITRRGGHVSIPGIVTFRNADMMRAVAARAPADRLHLETDSPFLTPVPHRGKKNEPAYLGLVAAKVAEVRGEGVAELGARCAANTRRFFRW